jgi:hypothetical protein
LHLNYHKIRNLLDTDPSLLEENLSLLQNPPCPDGIFSLIVRKDKSYVLKQLPSGSTVIKEVCNVKNEDTFWSNADEIQDIQHQAIARFSSLEELVHTYPEYFI